MSLRFRSPVLLVLIMCAAALSACGDENGNSATPPPLAGATGTAATGAAATVPAATTTPAAASGAACPAFTASGTQDDFAATVPLTTAADGLQSGDIKIGTGTAVAPHQSVTVNYTGWLPDGRVFDTSRQAGRTPAAFSLDQVIKGWTEGVVGMKPGGKRRLVIPAALGYGAQGTGCIPANTTLTFDIELVSVQ